MKRKIMSRRRDRKVFRNTADITKRINVFIPTLMRGGFRL